MNALQNKIFFVFVWFPTPHSYANITFPWELTKQRATLYRRKKVNNNIRFENSNILVEGQNNNENFTNRY